MLLPYFSLQKSEFELTDIKNSLFQYGIALIKGVFDDAQGKKLAMSLGNIVNLEPSDNGIVRINNISKGNDGAHGKGYTDEELYFHTDRSSLPYPPHLLMLWCEKPAESGGECLLVDGAEVYQNLKESDDCTVTQLMTAQSVIFTSGDTLYKGAIFEKLAGRIKVRFRDDENIFIRNNIIQSMDKFRSSLNANKISLLLNAGEGYIIQNQRWLHGRASFGGARVFNKIHINFVQEECENIGFQH